MVDVEGAFNSNLKHSQYLTVLETPPASITQIMSKGTSQVRGLNYEDDKLTIYN
jgi:hypothetical protein